MYSLTKIATLSKVREADEPLHPNNIPTGNSYKGYLKDMPEVGEPFYLFDINGWGEDKLVFRTSTVLEILPDNEFRTFNSIYKLQIEG